MSVSVSTSSSVSITTVFVIVLFCLKVTGNTTMSWFWVFSPWIIPAAVVLAFVIPLGLVGVIMDTVSRRRNLNRRYKEKHK